MKTQPSQWIAGFSLFGLKLSPSNINKLASQVQITRNQYGIIAHSSRAEEDAVSLRGSGGAPEWSFLFLIVDADTLEGAVAEGGRCHTGQQHALLVGSISCFAKLFAGPTQCQTEVTNDKV
ncbi:hypothetical protein ACVILK_003659 [Bradyrhizobium embrapense]